MTEEGIEFQVPLYGFAVVVTWDAMNNRWHATDNGHTETALLGKFDAWARGPLRVDQVLQAVGVWQTADRELWTVADNPGAAPEDAARRLIAAISYLNALRVYGPGRRPTEYDCEPAGFDVSMVG